MTNIFAYTNTNTIPVQLPAYISVNTPDDNAFKRVCFSVGSRGEHYPSEIELTFEQCEALATALLAHVGAINTRSKT